MFLLRISAILLFAATLAGAAAPAAPTNFTVKPLGTNAFLLKWKDNSKNETGWEISAIIGKSPNPPRFTLIPVKDIQSYVVVTNDLTNRTVSFRLRAYNGPAGAEVLSKPTPVVTVKALPQSIFKDPTNLTVSAVDDGRIRLKWKDNSTSENGYQIEFRKGNKGKWKSFGTTGPDMKFNLVLSLFESGTSYSFRVRGVRNSTLPNLTAYSNVATVTMPEFRGPLGLTATQSGEGDIALKWTDRSSHESGFELETRLGTGTYRKLGDLSANTISTTPITGFALDSNHQFRIRAFRLDGSTRIYTPYSNVLSVMTPKLAAPAGLAVNALSDSKVKLTWNHVSARESGFDVQYRRLGETEFTTANFNPANDFVLELSGLDSVTTYDFRVRAYDLSSYSNFSGTVRVTTKNGLTSSLKPPILANQRFLYQILASNAGAITNVTVTGLPAGLTFDSATRTIRGTVTSSGNYSATITITYSDGSTSVRTLNLATITRTPVSLSSFSTVNVAAAAQKTVSVDGKFADFDTPSAVRVSTNLGPFDIILFPDATPFTVDNFLKYVDADLYQDMFFHRAPPGFVVQGGGFKHTTAGGYARISTYPAVVNEPGLTNIRGTVAMAKLPNDPNSATSQFFVNRANNAGNLDSQNGGFTVFGRVADPGMTLIDQIGTLPISDYTINVGGNDILFEDFPVNAASAPVTPNPAELVKVSSVTDVPILTYTVTSQNSAVATAVLNGTNVVITGVATGSTTIEVKATDLDGLHVTRSIPVTVP
jgi:cyclophilin family peptidyl-prolyl cis-trans isomerase